MSTFSQRDDDDRERIAVVEDRQERRNDGTWIRWSAGLLVMLSVGALSTVINITQKQAVLETQMSDFRAEWQVRLTEINASIREHTITDSALKDAVVGLKMSVERLLQDREPAPRHGPVFPNGRQFENK